MQANQFLLVNFKKNHQAQFLLLQVETEGRWVLYSDQKYVSLDESEPIAFTGIRLD